MFFLHQLKTHAIHCVGLAVLPFSLLFFTLHFLLFHLGALRRAEVLILPEKLNFSGTVWVPDCARRRYPGRHLVFLTFREDNHNPFMPRVWDDIESVEFFSLPRFVFDFYFRGRRVIVPRRRTFDPLARAIIAFLSRWLGHSPDLLTYIDTYMEGDIPEAYRKDVEDMLTRPPGDAWATHWQGYWRYSTYYHLQREVSMKQPSLPQELCAEVEQALARVRGTHTEVRPCGFYIKKITTDGLVGTDHFLDGSPFVAYLPAIRFLVSRGYQVLLTGDHHLPRQVAEEFDGMVVDDEALGINPYLHMVYAALHTDIFVGDIGGGTVFAGLITNRLMLGLNTFPFSSAFNNFWVYYKHAYHHDGAHLSFAEMTGKYPHTTDVPATFTIEVNTADEILEAVRYYVEEIENPGSSEIDHAMEDMWPSFSWFKVGHCHISPAYVRNYRQKIATNPGSRSLNKAS